MKAFEIKVQEMIDKEQLTLSYLSGGFEEAFTELHQWLEEKECPTIPIELCFPSHLSCDETIQVYLSGLIKHLINIKKLSPIKLSGFTKESKDQDLLKFYNQLFLDLARSNQRGLQSNCIKIDINTLLQQLGQNTKPTEIRYAKLQMIKGEPIKATVQHSYQHTHTQQQEVQSEQQQVQQQEQQQSQLRQQQIEQLQERIRVYNKAHNNVDINSLGKLLTFSDLNNYAQETNQDYLKIVTVWENLVGSNEICRSVDDLRNKITHVSQAAFGKIVEYAHEFTYGLFPENMPSGFGIQYDEENQRSILYYDKNLEKTPDDLDYLCNPLTLKLIPKAKEPTLEESSVGQFFNFTSNTKALEFDYHQFKETSIKELFNKVFGDKGKKEEKLEACIKLIDLVAQNEEIVISKEVNQYLSVMLNEFSEEELNAFRWIIQKKGILGVLQWIELIQKLQQHDMYSSFRAVFLTHANDFTQFLDDENKTIIDELCQLGSWQKQWWRDLTEQHAKSTEYAHLKTLWQGFEFFVKSVKQMDIELPFDCPLKDIKHMQVALDRALFIMNHALDVEEQKEHLDLDYSQHGAVCASRTDGYYLVTSEMQLGRFSSEDIFNNLYRNNFRGPVDNLLGSIERVLSKKATLEERKKVIEQFIQSNQSEIEKGIFGSLRNIIQHAVVIRPIDLIGHFSSLANGAVETIIPMTIEAKDYFAKSEMGKYRKKRLQENIQSLTETKAVGGQGAISKFLTNMNLQFNKEEFRELQLGKEEQLKEFLDSDIRNGTLGLAKNQVFFIFLIKRQDIDYFCDEKFYLYEEAVITSSLINKKAFRKNCVHYEFSIHNKCPIVESNYKTDLKQLIKIAKEGKKDILAEHFFRYIGRQKETFSYKTYQALFNRISGLKSIVDFECYLAVIMSALTTNQRAIEVTLIEHACDKFLSYCQSASLDAQIEISSKLNELCNILPYLKFLPSIQDLLPIFKYFKEEEDLSYYLLTADKAGCSAFLYDFILDLEQRELFHSSNYDIFSQVSKLFLSNSYSLFQKNSFNSKHIDVYRRLIVVSKNDEWDKLSDILDVLKDLSAAKLHILYDLLKNVNFAATTLVDAGQIEQLIGAIQKIQDSPKLKLDIESLIIKYLPSVIFQQVELSEHLSLLVNSIKSFNGNLIDIRKQVDERYKLIIEIFSNGEQEEYFKSLLKGINWSEISSKAVSLTNAPIIPNVSWGMGFMKDHLVDYLTSYLTDKKQTLIKWINTIKNAVDLKFNAMQKALDKNDIKELFDQIDGLIKLLQNPFNVIRSENELSLFDKTLFFIIEPIFNKMVEKIKETITPQLHQLINPIFDYMIVDPIAKLWGGHAAVNREELNRFKKSLINFYKEQIAEVKNDSITQLINDQLKSTEMADVFIRALSKIPNEAVVSLVTVLNQNKYFSHTSSNQLIDSMTKIIVSIASLKSGDFPFIIGKLLNGLTKENSTIRLAAIDALKHTQGLTNELFNTLLEMGLSEQQIKIRDDLLNLHKTGLIKNHVLQAIATHAPGETVSTLVSWFLKNKSPNLIEILVEHYLKDKNQLSDFSRLLALFEQYDATSLPHFCFIMKAMQKQKISIDKQIELYEQLNTLNIKLLSLIASLYEKHPYPDYEKLNSVLVKKESVKKFCEQHDRDPFGRREKINYTQSTHEVMKYIKEITDLNTELPISSEDQRLLYQQYAYIMGISNLYSLPIITPNTEIRWKPLKEFSRHELNTYSKQLRQQFVMADETTKQSLYLEAIALASEVLFRTQGKYPATNQLLSNLVFINGSGNLIQQIDPGQGKTIVIAVNAFVEYLSGNYPNIASHDETLINRDFEEFKSFFDYVDIPTGLVDAQTEKNIYSPENRQISYGTPDNFVHYCSAQKILKPDSFALPDKSELVLFCDEVDSLILDYQARLNFSVSNSDPFNNPYKEFYPLINSFIDSELFIKRKALALQPGKQQDIINLRHYLAQKSIKYKRCKEELTDSLLDQWINSACIAKQLKENTHFVVNTIKRNEYKIEKTHSVAQILTNGIKDESASWSDGVHQFVHARLDEQYKDDIKMGKRPPFSCDSETEILDSRQIDDFFKFHGRFLGYTGTPGSKLELEEIIKKYMCTILKLPRRCPNGLKLSSPIFAEQAPNFFSHSLGYYEAIVEEIAKNRELIECNSVKTRQPVLIFVNDISDAEKMYQQLKMHLGVQSKTQVNLHHPNRTVSYSAIGGEIDLRQKLGDETLAKQVVVNSAGSGYTITITTGDQLGIGTDIESSNLFVIIADLFRKRKVAQYQNRTARGDKKGKTVTIYNMEKIAKKYKIPLEKEWTIKGQLKLIEKLQDRLDKEAKVEREWGVKVGEVQSRYSDHYDQLLKKLPHNKLAKRHKADFIKNAQLIWMNELKASNPEVKFSNPFVRYDEQNELINSPIELEKAFENYQEKVGELFKSSWISFPELKEISSQELEQVKKSNLPKKTILKGDHPSLFYNLYRGPLNDLTLGNESYSIRTRFLAWLAKNSSQFEEFEQHHKKLLLCDEMGKSLPLIDSLVTGMEHDNQLEWINFLIKSLALINKESQLNSVILSPTDTDATIIKNYLPFLLPSNNSLQVLLKMQLMADLSRTTDLEKIYQFIIFYAEQAFFENIYTKKESEFVTLIGKLIYEIACYVEKDKKLTYEKLTSTEILKLEGEMKQKWRQAIGNTVVSIPENINEQFKTLVEQVVSDGFLLIKSQEKENQIHEQWQSFLKEFSAWLIDKVNAVEIKDPETGAYSKAMTQRFERYDSGKEFLNKFIALVAFPPFNLEISTCVVKLAHEFLVGKNVVFSHLTQFYELLNTVGQLKEVNFGLVFNLFLKDLTKENLETRLILSKKLLVINQKGITEQGFAVALRLLLASEDDKYDCFVSLSKVKNLNFGKLVDNAEKLPLDILLIIRSWCENQYPIDLINKLMIQFFTESDEELFNQTSLIKRMEFYLDFAKIKDLEVNLLYEVADKLPLDTLSLLQDCIKSNYPVSLLNELMKQYLVKDKLDHNNFVKQLKNKELLGVVERLAVQGKKNNLLVGTLETAMEAEQVITNSASEFVDQTTERFIVPMIQRYINAQLKPPYAKANTEDVKQLHSLFNFINSLITKGSINQLADFNHCIVTAMNFVTQNISSAHWKQGLINLQDTIHAVSLSSPIAADKKKKIHNEVRLMVWQLNALLQKTYSRVNERSPYMHYYAQDKLNYIKLFQEQYCTEEAVTLFLEQNSNAESSLTLMTELMNQRISLSIGEHWNLWDIFSLNTRWGSTINTSSFADLGMLINRFKNEIASPYSPTQSNDFEQIKLNYIDSLKDIKTKLHHRASDANSFFKDIDVYKAKEKKLNVYIERIEKIFSKRKHATASEVASELRLLLQRVENDSVLNQSTSRISRFFNSKRNTTMMEISEVTHRFLASMQ